MNVPAVTRHNNVAEYFRPGLGTTDVTASMPVPMGTTVRMRDGLAPNHSGHALALPAQTYEEPENVDLRGGIDPGDPLTGKGRIKKRPRDKEAVDLDDPDRYRYKAYHIRRAFDLYGHIPTIINDGIKRRAKEAVGEDVSRAQSDRDYETFKLITNHLEGLNDDFVRFKRNPKMFRTLVRKIREAADQARNNDTANLKKDIGCMLSPDGSSVLTIIVKGKKASSKYDRGFQNDVMGRYLCPISLDWDNLTVRNDIRDGKYAILASDWPRLLYTDCDCNLDDLELGLGRNMALVRVVKYLFTGRSAAFSETAGGKTTRSGNAALAGMKEVSPRVVAYAACMLRYAISNEESWSRIDKEFDMHEFYWNVVSIFDDAEDFGRDLLAWWNVKVFGTSTLTSLKPDAPAITASISLLRSQRQAKRAAQRILSDVTNRADISSRANTPESEDEQSHQNHSSALSSQPETRTQEPALGTNQVLQSHSSFAHSQPTAYQTQQYFDPLFPLAQRAVANSIFPYHPSVLNPSRSQTQPSNALQSYPPMTQHSTCSPGHAYQGGPPPPPWYYNKKTDSSSADRSTVTATSAAT